MWDLLKFVQQGGMTILQPVIFCVCVYCVCVMMQRAKVYFANVLMCRVCSPDIIQTRHQDWTGWGSGRRRLNMLLQFRVSTGPPSQSFHWMCRTSLSFRPKRVLYFSKRHWRELMYIAWYRSTISSVGSSIFGTVIGSPTIIEQKRIKTKKYNHQS